eukprot:gene12258-biopygen19937
MNPGSSLQASRGVPTRARGTLEGGDTDGAKSGRPAQALARLQRLQREGDLSRTKTGSTLRPIAAPFQHNPLVKTAPDTFVRGSPECFFLTNAHGIGRGIYPDPLAFGEGCPPVPSPWCIPHRVADIPHGRRGHTT